MRSRAGAGLPRAMRLADKLVFGALLRSRGRVVSGPLMLQMLPGKEKGGRLGMAVAKRHAKRSVERNLLKRLLREAYRQHSISDRPVDLVVSLRAGWQGGVRPSARKTLREHVARVMDQAAERWTTAEGQAPAVKS